MVAWHVHWLQAFLIIILLVCIGMLPKTVANDLIYGKPAPATSFQSATIFFRYIVFCVYIMSYYILRHFNAVILWGSPN